MLDRREAQKDRQETVHHQHRLYVGKRVCGGVSSKRARTTAAYRPGVDTGELVKKYQEGC
jgi:hypothetical protein